jgi:hypothetical protein
MEGSRGRDCMIVGFTITYAISAYHQHLKNKVIFFLLQLIPRQYQSSATFVVLKFLVNPN